MSFIFRCKAGIQTHCPFAVGGSLGFSIMQFPLVYVHSEFTLIGIGDGIGSSFCGEH